MEYQISETERRCLEEVSDQLDLICGCLCLADGQLQTITSNSLNTFLEQRRKEIDGVLTKLEERQDADFKLAQSLAREQEQKQKQLAQSIPPELLVRVIEACSGSVVAEQELVTLYSDLYDATVLHGRPEPFEAFGAALEKAGYKTTLEINSTGTQFTIKRTTNKARAPSKLTTTPRKREALERV